MAKSPDSETVVITRLLVQRREFWIAVLAIIISLVVVILAVLWLYPELLSEIVDLWDDELRRWQNAAPRLLEPYEYLQECASVVCATWTPAAMP